MCHLKFQHVRLSHCHNVTLSHCHNVTLSQCHMKLSATMSHNNTLCLRLANFLNHSVVFRIPQLRHRNKIDTAIYVYIYI